MFLRGAAEGNIEIRGKQNELFPEGPVIKFLLFLFKEPPKMNCIMGFAKISNGIENGHSCKPNVI